MLYLVEHFFSIQGEGRHLGTPSIFLRFGGCNMRCSGFGTKVTTPQGTQVIGCDTAYAVFKEEFGHTWQEVHTLETLTSIVQSYDLSYKADVVLTGGEPLLYANDPLFVSFVAYLVKQEHRVTFETNGAIAVDFDRFEVYKECTFALSVKLSCSGESEKKRINAKVLKEITTQGKEVFYKFTIDPTLVSSALEEIEHIVALGTKRPIYCMPMSDSKATIEASCEAVIAFCKEHGFIYSDRLHIRIWDEIQGV